MKRLLTTLCVLVIAFSANAQEAFKHLSIGLEAGTVGTGVQLALPIVSDHLVLTAGYNFPNYSFNTTIPYGTGKLSDVISNVNNTLEQVSVPDRLSDPFSQDIQVSLNTRMNFGAAKALLEYYPWKNVSFHIVAGAYFGTDDLLFAELMTDREFWRNINSLQAEVNAIYDKYKEIPEVVAMDHDLLGRLKVTVDGTTYEVKEKNGCAFANASIAIAKVRPYFGIGFGRSIPKSHVAVQFDLGAWYHGHPSLKSDNATAYYDPSAESFNLGAAADLLSGICIWPQLSLKLIIRLF
ncbi:MAG: hypothetical protein KBT00_04215 [Bacteroidales bacterium]|nr:hypothetical protein [Candidatus Cacconaster merdequi]